MKNGYRVLMVTRTGDGAVVTTTSVRVMNWTKSFSMWAMIAGQMELFRSRRAATPTPPRKEATTWSSEGAHGKEDQFDEQCEEQRAPVGQRNFFVSVSF